MHDLGGVTVRTINDVAMELKLKGIRGMSSPQLYKYANAGIIKIKHDEIYGTVVPDSENETIQKIIVYRSLNYNINQIEYFISNGIEPDGLAQQKKALAKVLSNGHGTREETAAVLEEAQKKQ